MYHRCRTRLAEAMTSIPHLQRTLVWAHARLGTTYTGDPIQATVLPWSATARLTVDDRRYWVKCGLLANSAVEASVLSAAREKGIAAVPVLIDYLADLGGLLLAEVGHSHSTQSPAEVLSTRADISHALADVDVPALTAAGCAERCATDPIGWLEPQVRSRLAETVAMRQRQIADLDDRLSADSPQLVHGDLHPGNVLVTDAGPVLLDWADAARGSPRWDAATYACAMDSQSTSPVEKVLAGLKEIADFLVVPTPSERSGYSIDLTRIRQHINDRAEQLRLALVELTETETREHSAGG